MNSIDIDDRSLYYDGISSKSKPKILLNKISDLNTRSMNIPNTFIANISDIHKLNNIDWCSCKEIPIDKLRFIEIDGRIIRVEVS